MPIFRYKCNNCGKQFEKLLPRFDAQSKCPACNSDNLERELNKE